MRTNGGNFTFAARIHVLRQNSELIAYISVNIGSTEQSLFNQNVLAPGEFFSFVGHQI
jgi:hypothetical protein